MRARDRLFIRCLRFLRRDLIPESKRQAHERSMDRDSTLASVDEVLDALGLSCAVLERDVKQERPEALDAVDQLGLSDCVIVERSELANVTQAIVSIIFAVAERHSSGWGDLEEGELEILQSSGQRLVAILEEHDHVR